MCKVRAENDKKDTSTFQKKNDKSRIPEDLGYSGVIILERHVVPINPVLVGENWGTRAKNG